MNRVSFFIGIAMLAFCVSTSVAQVAKSTDEPSSRHFQLTYGGKVNGLESGAKVRVWLPVPQDSTSQKISIVEQDNSRPGKMFTEPVYGNKMMMFKFEAGDAETEFAFQMVYGVQRAEVNSLEGNSDAKLTDRERARFMSANRMVPVNGKPIELLGGVAIHEDKVAAAKELYDRVEGHMTYDKSNPGYGNGDVLWACDSKTGNCTDFHSLFISFARSQQIPAHFEIGFPLPEERGEGKIGGYHCWAKFFVDGKGWMPVDISEADKHPEMKEYYFGNLTENRVTFSKGRDIVLEPAQANEPLNYFVYPYVEVNGKVWPRENISLNFRFKDVPKK